MKYVSGRIVRGIYTWLGLEWGSGRANRKWFAHAGRLVVQQVVEGRVYISACAGGNYCCVMEGCLLSLSL